MDIKKVALGLLFGGSIALGAIACEDTTGGGTTGTTGTTGATTGATTGTPTDTHVPTCNPATDTDTGTASFTITNLGLPQNSGFNLDGLNNSAATGGATVAGCGKPDATGGIDNALGSIAASLEGVIDLNTALGETLVHQVADGGYEGSITVDVELTKLAAANAANDSCVGATVTIGGAGAPLVLTASGALVNNVLDLAFASELTFTISLDVPASSCVNMQCNDGSLSIAIRGGRARLNLNAAHTAIGAGSLIGGFIFFEDCTGGTVDPNTGACTGGTYAAVNPTGFKGALENFASMVNLDPSFTTMAVEAFKGARDLHMEVNGALSPCTGANNTSTNRNAVSVALAIDSL